MQPEFIHLRVHSEYSLVDGVVRIKPLIQRVAEMGMPAVALTDHTNLFALVKFYRAAQAGGIKAIVGADLLITDPDNIGQPHRMTLLVQNEAGYLALKELISRGYQEGQHQGVPMVQQAWIAENNSGLIALSGAREGVIGKALLSNETEPAQRELEQWMAIFDQRFYLELQRTNRPDEERYIEQVVKLAAAFDAPVVATNDVRFLDRETFEAHEARVCINQGRVLEDRSRPRLYSEQQYLRSPAEMKQLFADIPEALQNSVEIAKRCNLGLTLGENVLPDFPVPDNMGVNDYFAQQSWQGLEERLAFAPPVGSGTAEENRAVYDQRLQRELDVIIEMGFPGYFLIVADFIQWAKQHDIPVGPGRGSGAGSLVAYVLKITDIDPLEFELLFERFLNPERVSMPDFDIDFCMEGRDRVIDYVAERYGRDRVSQIITYGSMAAKAVVRDVGRVLGHGYGFVDRLAKLIPFEIGMTLEKALQESEELARLYHNDEEVQGLLDLAKLLEGIARNAGKHAGGVVIAPSKLTDFTPLYCEQESSSLVTQFDKDDVEAVGLVKFDFLGLRTLTIIDWALKTINQQQQQAGEAEIEINRIPRDDPETYQLLMDARTTAVFQLESRGMKDLIRRLQPDCFEDVIALVALFRPGPLQSGMVDDYIAVKHKRQKAEYPHPVVEPILKPTNGVILYQEQVMQIAQELSGYTLGGADMLRRAMGKKKPEEMAKQRAIFTEGALNEGVEESVATYIFDLMEKFAGYGFNKTVGKDTLIYTVGGVKTIRQCQPGDKVFSYNAAGAMVCSRVVALHDHGEVPLWKVKFDDGATERCTLDHKWLTSHGQLPLWRIIRMGVSVWGVARLQRSAFRAERSQSTAQVQHHQADLLQRKVVQITFIGWQQGYDLEVDHPLHNFLLASGLYCSNSHSAAYALVAYQTAWLKTHYPAPFMAAVISADMDSTDKVVILVEECRAMKITLLPPDINRSFYHFTVNSDGAIVYGLGAIKGVGESAIEQIIAERKANGPFSDLQALCHRLDSRKVNRRVLEALIRAGALDPFGDNRAAHSEHLTVALKTAEQQSKMEQAGQADLFGLAMSMPEEGAGNVYGLKEVEPWTDAERLVEEKLTLGLYLSGHPIHQYEEELAQMTSGRIHQLVESAGSGSNEVRLAGLVVELRTRQNKSGKQMGFVTLEDRSGRLEVGMFAEVYERYWSQLSRDEIVIVEGTLGIDNFSGEMRMRVEQIFNIEQARGRFAKYLLIGWNSAAQAASVDFTRQLQALIEPFKGGPCPVFIDYQAASARTRLRLGEVWRVYPSDTLLDQLTKRIGADRVKLVYSGR